jgi:hypothetical protein
MDRAKRPPIRRSAGEGYAVVDVGVDGEKSAPAPLCPECKQPVLEGATICAGCKSYLDWRRFLVFGQTTLALLVALIAVLTAFIPVLRDVLTPKDSNLSFNYQGPTSFGFEVLISNTGIRPAVLHNAVGHRCPRGCRDSTDRRCGISALYS